MISTTAATHFVIYLHLLVSQTGLQARKCKLCLKVIKLFSCLTQLSTKFILLMNVKMPTFVGILTFISMINTASRSLKIKRLLYLSVF